MEGQLTTLKEESEKRTIDLGRDLELSDRVKEQEVQIVSLTKDRERLMEEQVVDREQLATLKQENVRVSARLDSLLEVT